MRGVTGTINDQVFVSLSASNENPYSKSPILLSGNLGRGWVITTPDVTLEGTLTLSYSDIMNILSVSLTEDKSFPLTKLYVKLPNPERLVCSELFIEGYFKFQKVNIETRKKTIPINLIHESLFAGKKVNVLDRLFIEKIGDPLLKMSVVKTSYGDIQQLRAATTIEI